MRLPTGKIKSVLARKEDGRQDEWDEERQSFIDHRDNFRERKTRLIEVNSILPSKNKTSKNEMKNRMSPRGIHEFVADEPCQLQINVSAVEEDPESFHILQESLIDDRLFTNDADIDADEKKLLNNVRNGSPAYDFESIIPNSQMENEFSVESDTSRISTICKNTQEEMMNATYDKSILSKHDASRISILCKNTQEEIMNATFDESVLSKHDIDSTAKFLEFDISCEESELGMSVIESERLNYVARQNISKGMHEEALLSYEAALGCAIKDIRKIREKMRNEDFKESDDNRNAVDEESNVFSSSNSANTKIELKGDGKERKDIGEKRNKKDSIVRLQKRRNLIASTIAHTLNNMGVVHEILEHYDDALQSCREALSIYSDLCKDPSSDKNVDRTMQNIAQIIRAKESYEERAELHRQADGLRNYMNTSKCIGDMKSTLQNLLILYKKVHKIEQLSLGSKHPQSARTRCSIGGIQWRLLGIGVNGIDAKDVMHEFSSATQTLEDAFGKNHPHVVSALLKLARMKLQVEGIDTALATYGRVLEAQRVLCAEDGSYWPKLATTLNSVGVLYARKKNSTVSMERFKEALSHYRKESVSGEERGDIAMVWRNIGQIHLQQDELNEALNAFENSMLIRRNLLGDDHVSVAILLSNIGVVYNKMNDFSKSISCHESSIRILKTVYGEESQEVGKGVEEMGKIYEERGDLQGAMECYLKALSIKQKANGHHCKDKEISLSLLYMGSIYTKRIDYEEALVSYGEVLELSRASGIADGDNLSKKIKSKIKKLQAARSSESSSAFETRKSSNTLDKKLRRACVFDRMGIDMSKKGNPDDAIEAFSQALKIRRSKLNHNDADIAMTLFNIATAYRIKKEFFQAKIFYDEATKINRENGIFKEDACAKSTLNVLY